VVGWLSALLLTVFLLHAGQHARAEPNPEVTEMVAELIGAPVFAKDGIEVGEVADIAFNERLEPERLRMRTAAVLGLGGHTVEIPKELFMALRGAVVIDLPSELVPVLAAKADSAAKGKRQ
jgi:sporulation protein YlmC with PRC-barrel domain